MIGYCSAGADFNEIKLASDCLLSRRPVLQILKRRMLQKDRRSTDQPCLRQSVGLQISVILENYRRLSILVQLENINTSVSTTKNVNLEGERSCKMIQNLLVIGFIILPNLGGIVGGLITIGNIPWYEKLKKPSWRPPNWAFGPIWTAIYSLIGYSSYLIFKSGDWREDPVQKALLVYGANLLVNWLWTPIFFGVKNLKLINSTAGYLYVPYLIWLVLATALNYEILRDNPDALGIKDLETTKVQNSQPCYNCRPQTTSSPSTQQCKHCQSQMTPTTPCNINHNDSVSISVAQS
nr:unnamed protein product [Callosobruchus chinensis]